MDSRAALLALPLSILPTTAGAQLPRAAPALAARARYLVHIGEFVSSTAVDPSLTATARETLQRRLARTPLVVLSNGEGAPPPGQRPPPIEYTIDGRVQVLEGTGATRVEVSLLVQAHPGRQYRFESVVSLTLVGETGREVLAGATRHAVERATAQCLHEFARL